ncbi:MAG: P-II family nitrogen regulator [Nitrospiria bacterium]
MKEVKAYIKPHKLSKVTLALHKVEEVTGMTAVDVRGFGRSRAKNAPRRIVDDLVDYLPYVKVEVVCSDLIVEKVIAVIQEAAYTGLRGDGKIYVSGIETAVRIETGERGKRAV